MEARVTPKKLDFCLSHPNYKVRSIGEYWFVKTRYEKLHSMIVKREAGKLDFTPNCPMEQWKAQAEAMGQYLYQLEVKAAYEDVCLDDIFEGTTMLDNIYK